MKKLSEQILHKIIQERPAQSHKGDYGRVGLIGGNQQYGGAIIMSSMAAVHSGAGLVTTITHPKNHTALQSILPEAMTVDWSDYSQIKKIVPQLDVLVIGPGMGIEQESLELLQFILPLLSSQQLCIVDGSAITLFAKHKLQRSDPYTTIFTPHEMEWQRLSHIPIAQQTQKKNQEVQQQLQSIVVLKKHRTEIYSTSNIWQNTLGSPAIATGGMGDILAGMIGGFLGQFKNKQTEEIVNAAVYLHSYIGEALAKKNYVVLPTQIVKEIPSTMKLFEKTNSSE